MIWRIGVIRVPKYLETYFWIIFLNPTYSEKENDVLSNQIIEKSCEIQYSQ